MRMRKTKWAYKDTGFTLVELLAVLVILSLLMAIAIPIVPRLKERAISVACESSRKILERDFDSQRLKHAKESDLSFNQFLISYPSEICPSGGVITRENDVIHCSQHSPDKELTQPEEVPWL